MLLFNDCQTIYIFLTLLFMKYFWTLFFPGNQQKKILNYLDKMAFFDTNQISILCNKENTKF